MSFLHNFWFQLKAKQKPKLTDTKTQKLIDRHNLADQKLVQSLSQKKLPRPKQIKYIGKYLTPKEKFLIKIFSVIIVLAIIFIGANSYFNLTEPGPAVGGEYTEGLVGAPEFINPILAQTNDVDLDIVSLIFNGLLKYHPDQGLINDLAEKYEISEDQKIYTFELKDNVYWHDGTKLTMEDVLFTFERLKDTNTKSPLYFNFKGVSLEKIDDKTFRFILEEPFAPFLESLTTGILPSQVWRNVPVQNTNLSEFNLKPIGSGPYKFKSLTKDNKTGQIKSYTLERNESYFDETAKIKEIIFKFYFSFEQAIEALNNKNIEGLSFLPTEKQRHIINNRSLNFHQLNLPQYTALFFNKSKNDIFKDLKIRALLAQAVDRDKIISEALNAQAQKIDGPILPGQLGYTDEVTKYNYDVEKVKKGLTDLGWELTDYVIETEEESDEGTVVVQETFPFKIRKKGDKYLEFEITTVNQPENTLIAEMIQKDLQLVGVKVNLKFAEPGDIQKDIIKTREYQALLYGQIIGLDPDPYAFWHSSQVKHPGLNLSLYTNTDVDKYLEEARKNTDAQKRAENYQKFQQKIADEMPAIFLYNSIYTYPQTKKIQGFNSHTIIVPANRFANINDWFIKTKRSFK